MKISLKTNKGHFIQQSLVKLYFPQLFQLRKIMQLVKYQKTKRNK
jgi:hypothetical protein